MNQRNEIMEKQPLLNTYVNNVSMAETLDEISRLVEEKKKSYVVAINVDVVMKMEKDEYLKKITDEAETEIICSAIYHHDDKLVIDAPMDEVLKDADVIDHCFKDSSKPVKEKEQSRYDKLCVEFGM